MLATRRFAPLTLLLTLLAAGCEAPPEPVGSLQVSPAEVALAYPQLVPIEITVAPTAELGASGPVYVMVHVLDATGDVVRTFDHPLPVDWTPGQGGSYSIDLYQSALAPPLAAGSYRLTMGLYSPETGRWALATDGEEVATQEYVVAHLTTKGRSGGPKFFFSPTWQATEAGTDVQILGRRWLRGEGQIRIAELPGAGTLRLVARIPEPNSDLEDLVLSEGYDEVTLDVTTTCSEESWSFTGLGTHTIDLAIGGEVGECELQFVPHYQIVTRLNLDGRAFAVDLLAWQPAG